MEREQELTLEVGATVQREKGQRSIALGRKKWWCFHGQGKEPSGGALGAGEMVKIQSNVISTTKKKAKDGKRGGKTDIQEVCHFFSIKPAVV